MTDLVTQVIKQGYISDIRDYKSDIRVVSVRLDLSEKLVFIPGQYVYLLIDGFDPRPYSIANLPGADVLEFHIRNTGFGLSRHIFEDMKPGDRIGVDGPHGQALYNAQKTGGDPVLLLAGGLGIAQLRSILMAALKNHNHVPVTLYWGVEYPDDLYLADDLKKLVAAHPQFSFIPVIRASDGGGDFRTGTLDTVLQADFENGSLHRHHCYVAGPPGMVHALYPVLLDKGMVPARFYCDLPV